MSSMLVRALGFPATLIHGDTLVLDRWLWLRKHLPHVSDGAKTLLDVGCGSGAFTIGSARRGYRSLGLSWDRRNQDIAGQRAVTCGAQHAEFEVLDVRRLDERTDLRVQFDLVICCENIEHIQNDRKLMFDMADCLKPDGTLLLTTPNFQFKPVYGDDGVISTMEDGGHVRRGYTEEALRSLCKTAHLEVLEIGYCSGYTSQKITGLLRFLGRLHYLLGWAVVLPLRAIPPLVDPLISQLTRYPSYSINLIARKSS
jgi:2-polyprenyl-3-methyl-5-hydroxy-6-metoxy-1,4-benzoquinol methylase